MMRVPVLWVSRHPDILARGYFDQGFLEQMLDRRVWRPPNPITFEHHEVRGDFPDVDGALVVLPARHHTSDEDVAWFRGQLDRLDWSVVLLAGDEEWAFPWAEIPETETRRVWVMQPRPEHAHLSGLIPGGWYPDTPELIRPWLADMAVKPLEWFFAGQVTHERREACVEVLRRLTSGKLHETDGYLRGMPREEYSRLLAQARVVPCPSGPMTVDTARPLEAMEAGCVPVADRVTPRGEHYDYWGLVFREQPPFPEITNWATFPRVLREALYDFDFRAARVSAWWQQWKRRITRQLDADLRAVAGQSSEVLLPDDAITVLVTTSPIPSHPDTAIIEETIASVRAQLPDAEVVIVADGVRPELAHRRDDYMTYLRRLTMLCEHEWHNVVPVVLDEWGHQANATRAALELVETPLLLFVEHDTPVEGFIPWGALARLVRSGAYNAVRFHHETTMLDAHQHMMIDQHPRPVNAGSVDVPLIRTAAWWQRPHLASTRFYRERIMPLFSEESRTMIEDHVYGLMSSAVNDHGEAGWWDWRVAIYAPPWNMKRSNHLDGRGDDPKFGMRT